jgi:hypothetical protein
VDVLTLLAASTRHQCVPLFIRPVEFPPFPLEDAASARVADALEGAVLRHDETRRELQAAIESCVRSLRAQGMSPEGTLVTLKAFVKHSAVAFPTRDTEGRKWAADSLMTQIVHWGVVEYFNER